MAKLIITGATIERAGVGAVAIIGGWFGIQVGLAQEADSVTVDVGECVDLTSPEERLACFERSIEAAKQEGPVAAAEPPIVGARETDAEREANKLPEVIATVAELRETLPNSYLITLDNGQVWRQNRPKWYPLQPGYKVRLYPSRWGSSYRLAADKLNSFIQVERVR